MMFASPVSKWLSSAGFNVGRGGGSVLVSSCSTVVPYQPTVDFASWTALKGIFTTSSMGGGKDQCAPGPSKALSPSPIGFPKRNTTARSCGPTVKNPDAKNSTTSPAMRILTIRKLLRSASESAVEPASSCMSWADALGLSCEWSWSCVLIEIAASFLLWVEQIQRRCALI